jgi:preprotein translocase subunit SecA
VLVTLLGHNFPEKGEPDEEALATLAVELEQQFGLVFDPTKPPFMVDGKPASDRDGLGHALLDQLLAHLAEKERHWNEVAEKYQAMGYPRFRELEKGILLDTLDRQWKDHLLSMDGLREGINLRGYAQKDPKVEYQREGFQLFEEMIERIDTHAVERIFKVAIREPQLAPTAPAAPAAPAGPQLATGTGPAVAAAPGPLAVPAARPAPMAPIFKPAFGSAAHATGKPGGKTAGGSKTPGRNDPCTCGSGKKYKKCCGAS